MRTLGIDIETYADIDLTKVGMFKYVELPNFEILMIAVSYDHGEPKVYDIWSGDVPPKKFFDDLQDQFVLKTAFNAMFEMTCLQKFYKIKLDPKQWSCTMVLGGYLGLPMSLDKAGPALGLDTVKDKQGKALIRYFSVPRKPTTTENRVRNFAHHEPEKWQMFMDYCKQDVRVEQKIRETIKRLVHVPEREHELYAIDQVINWRGVMVDIPFIKNCIRIDSLNRERLLSEMVMITKIENGNSTPQLKTWLGDKNLSLTKETIPLIIDFEEDKNRCRALQIKLELNKTSVKKYYKMITSRCKDDRLKGMLQFNGAGRTARWAGREVQLHNLPKNNMVSLDTARRVVSMGDFDLFGIMYGGEEGSYVLSQLIRTAFIPIPGHKFIISDFSAIEARVTAWLAQERWRLIVFNSDGKIYEASASMMFKVAIELCGKGTELRYKGKTAELALGYGGAEGAIKRMDNIRELKFKNGNRVRNTVVPLTYKERTIIKKKWRAANPKIVQLWKDLNNAAVGAIEDGDVKTVGKWLKFWFKNRVLYIKLPSGRCLMYYDAQLREGQYGDEVTYMGQNQTTGQWERQKTYGGKLLENIVQATSRDLLAEKIIEVEESGYPVALHVHDEIVSEVEKSVKIEVIDKIMSSPVSWAPGLPLKGASYESLYYRKDD